MSATNPICIWYDMGVIYEETKQIYFCYHVMYIIHMLCIYYIIHISLKPPNSKLGYDIYCERYKVFNYMKIAWKHCCQARKFAKVDI